jgi:serine protease Do
MYCSIARRARHVLALIVPLSFGSVAPWVAHANAEPDSIAAVVAKVSSAVVRIVTVGPPRKAEDKPGTKAASTAATDAISTAVASGFIIDPSGYIATNKHVVDGVTSVFVTTADGVRYPAKVVGLPGRVDMALLRIDAAHKLPFLNFGDSDKMRVGDAVIAIGSPFGFDNSVTAGIISAVNRDIVESPFDNYFQTDAAINHGSSGGPLLNLSGEVIGMNSVIFSPDPGSAGVGFALPSNDLKFVFDRLKKTGEIKAGMLPLHTQRVTWTLQQALDAPHPSGALVTSVDDDGDTMLQGKIKPGDVILTFNSKTVRDPRDLARKLARAPIGGDAALEIFRGDVRETVHVTIAASPESKPIVRNDDGQRTLGLELVSGRGETGLPIVAVASVNPAGTAADSGLRKGDIIVEVQQTPVSEPDQALRIFGARSSMKHHFAAVLVKHDKKLSWVSVAVLE